MAKKGYEEDGETLENLSAFTGQGFASFPNVYEDNKRIGAATEYTDQRIANMRGEYEGFIQREDIMPRARFMGNRILKHLGFEHSQRSESRKQEDESCHGNI